VKAGLPLIAAAVAFATALVSATGAGTEIAQTPPAAPPAAPAAQAEPRPAPPPAFTKVCVKCHPVEKIVEGRRYRTQWDQVLEAMVARGAIATDQELDVIFDYLVANYGRVEINTAAADEIAEVLHVEPNVAAAIVQQRTSTGRIADFDALKAVPGVPVAALEKMRDAIVY
jgi:competence ComEA-like helix-hairpin-helix protein